MNELTNLWGSPLFSAIVEGVVALLSGAFLMLYKDNVILRKELHEFKVEVPKTYVTHNTLNEHFNRLDHRLDKIDTSLERIAAIK